MSNDLDSNARCLKAIELTFRAVLTCFVPLGFILFAICLAFGNSYKPGVNAGLIILVSYLTVAYRNVGRGNKTALVIAGLAGLTAANVAAEGYSANGASESSPAFNPTTGLMMGEGDMMGQTFGGDINSGVMSGDDTQTFGDNDCSFNPANGLPMMDDVTDIHGNMVGTNSVDDLMACSSLTFDDSIAHTSFDDSFNNSTFDDD